MSDKPIDDIEEEDNCYDDCHKVEFKDVVGAQTLADGGHLGSFLKLARLHIDDAKTKGELTEGAAGEVYAKAIEGSMAQAAQFGLQSAKMQIDIKLVDAQVEYQKHKIKLEKEQFALENYVQRAKLSLETLKTHSDVQVNEAQIVHIETQDKQIFQQIKQSEQEIEQIKESILKMKCECKNQTATTNSKLDVDKAQIVQMQVQDDVSVKTSNSKIKVEETQIIQMRVQDDVSIRTANSKIKVEDTQMIQMGVQNEVSRKTTDSKIDVEKAQIVKMSVENSVSVRTANSKIALEKSQSQKIAVDAKNETALNNSKIHLNNNQIGKMKCDCKNQEKISSAQANLYAVQMQGFRDNARQKLFETQMQGYAMVFEAADFSEKDGGNFIPDFFTKPHLDGTFTALRKATFCP